MRRQIQLPWLYKNHNEWPTEIRNRSAYYKAKQFTSHFQWYWNPGTLIEFNWLYTPESWNNLTSQHIKLNAVESGRHLNWYTSNLLFSGYHPSKIMKEAHQHIEKKPYHFSLSSLYSILYWLNFSLLYNLLTFPFLFQLSHSFTELKIDLDLYPQFSKVICVIPDSSKKGNFRLGKIELSFSLIA